MLLNGIGTGVAEPTIVAHRGASRDAPENTLPAFKQAWAQGADAIEGDFHLTKDGHIVCMHDANTKKVSGKNLVIKESTLDKLRELDVGVYRGKEFTGTLIPTIAEVFSTIPDQKKIYIEIKCGKEIIPKLLEEFRRSGLEQEQMVVISFDHEVIKEFKAKEPHIKAFWLSGFKKNIYGKSTPSVKTVLRVLKRINADGFSSSKDISGESFIKQVMEHGYEYHVWTVDDLNTAKRFRKWGAKSITTNVPGYIKQNLIERNTPVNRAKPRR